MGSKKSKSFKLLWTKWYVFKTCTFIKISWWKSPESLHCLGRETQVGQTLRRLGTRFLLEETTFWDVAKKKRHSPKKHNIPLKRGLTRSTCKWANWVDLVYGLVFRSFSKSRNRGYPIEVAGFFGASLGFVLDSNPMAGKGRKLSYFDVPGTARCFRGILWWPQNWGRSLCHVGIQFETVVLFWMSQKFLRFSYFHQVLGHCGEVSDSIGLSRHCCTCWGREWGASERTYFDTIWYVCGELISV